MSSKKSAPSNTVKLNTVLPEPVVTPLKLAKTATKVVKPAVAVPQGEMVKKQSLQSRQRWRFWQRRWRRVRS